MSDLREKILNAKPKQQDVATPFWEGTDGCIALQDIPAGDLGTLQIQLQEDPMKLAAATLCKALIDKRTGERIFSDADRDAVMHLGTSVLTPLMQQVGEFFGMDAEAVERTKKNLRASQNGATGSGSAKGAHLVV